MIPKAELQKLYHEDGFSPRKIGEKFGCNWATISNRLKEYNIPLKSPAMARMRYKKFDFSGNDGQKAYMIGLRIGDLNVYRVSQNSETLVVRCHTTQKQQVDVIYSLFGKYGKVSVSKNKAGNYHINCFLNNSFYFLFPKSKNAWEWITDKDVSFAFMAGYTDAEGNFILNQKRARFKLDSYDRDVLESIACWLEENDISYKLRLIQRQGDSQTIRGKLGAYHGNLWRLNINDAGSVEKFILNILPHLRHRTRVKDAKTCLRNINQRRINGTVK